MTTPLWVLESLSLSYCLQLVPSEPSPGLHAAEPDCTALIFGIFCLHPLLLFCAAFRKSTIARFLHCSVCIVECSALSFQPQPSATNAPRLDLVCAGCR